MPFVSAKSKSMWVFNDCFLLGTPLFVRLLRLERVWCVKRLRICQRKLWGDIQENEPWKYWFLSTYTPTRPISTTKPLILLGGHFTFGKLWNIHSLKGWALCTRRSGHSGHWKVKLTLYEGFMAGLFLFFFWAEELGVPCKWTWHGLHSRLQVKKIGHK